MLGLHACIGWMAWKGVEGVRTLPTQRTFTCIKSKRLSIDREGRSLVPMVCGLAIIHSLVAKLTYPPSCAPLQLRLQAAEGAIEE